MKQGDKVLVEAVYIGGDDVGGNCVVDVIGRRLDVHTSAIRPLPDPIAEEPRPWVHDWATCRATDNNGREHEFEYIPYPDDDSAGWEPETGKCFLIRDRGRKFPNWRETLEYRYPEQALAHKLAEAVGMTIEELRAAVKELMK